MPTSRRKVSAALRDFDAELSSLARFDAENQAIFSASTTASRAQRLSKRQLYLLTEAIFFAAFRAYENFLRDVFLLYCLEKRPASGRKVGSYLKPKNFAHSEKLIKSSMPFLDWSNPDIVLQRAELYLEEGFPIKLPYTSNREALADFKLIRNHIAHNSAESLQGYKRVLTKHYRTVPLSIPSPGGFLLVAERSDPTKYKLLAFFGLMRQISKDLT